MKAVPAPQTASPSIAFSSFSSFLVSVSGFEKFDLMGYNGFFDVDYGTLSCEHLGNESVEVSFFTQSSRLSSIELFSKSTLRLPQFYNCGSDRVLNL